MSKYVKHTRNLEAVSAEAKKLFEQHAKTIPVPIECPKCSKEITATDGLNVCPLCKFQFPANAIIEDNTKR